MRRRRLRWWQHQRQQLQQHCVMCEVWNTCWVLRHGDCLPGAPPHEADSNYHRQWTIHGGMRTAFRRNTAQIQPTGQHDVAVDRAKSKENEISVKALVTHVSHKHQADCTEAVCDDIRMGGHKWLAVQRKFDCMRMKLLFPKELAAELMRWVLWRLGKANLTEQVRDALAKKVTRSKSAALEVLVQSGWMQWDSDRPGTRAREKLVFMPSVVQSTRSTCLRLALVVSVYASRHRGCLRDFAYIGTSRL